MKAVWGAEYTVHIGDREQSVSIEDTETDECPRSIVLRSKKAGFLVQQIAAARVLRKASGTHPFGPSKTWPGWLTDSHIIIENERAALRAAISKAI